MITLRSYCVIQWITLRFQLNCHRASNCLVRMLFPVMCSQNFTMKTTSQMSGRSSNEWQMSVMTVFRQFEYDISGNLKYTGMFNQAENRNISSNLMCGHLHHWDVYFEYRWSLLLQLASFHVMSVAAGSKKQASPMSTTWVACILITSFWLTSTESITFISHGVVFIEIPLSLRRAV